MQHGITISSVIFHSRKSLSPAASAYFKSYSTCRGFPNARIAGARILVMGLAFKENCPDVRNTRVVDIVSDLVSYNARVDVYDPCVNPEEARHEYGITPVRQPEAGAYDAIIVAVAHDQFKAMGAPALRALGKPLHVLYDLKYALAAADSDLRL